MPTAPCPDCGRPVGPAAASCPGCGRVLRGPRPTSTTGSGAVLMLLALLIAVPVGAVAAFLTNGDVFTVTLVFFGPIIGALVMASRRR
jgi:hypothetical protein